MPDKHGYDPYRQGFRPGETVYVVDATHAWQAVFVGYKKGHPYVQAPGGEYLRVEPSMLRRSVLKYG